MATVSRGEITITNVNDGKTPYFHTAYTNSTDFGAYDYSGNPNLSAKLNASSFSSGTGATVEDDNDEIVFTLDGTNPLLKYTTRGQTPLVEGKEYTISCEIMLESDFVGDPTGIKLQHAYFPGGILMLQTATVPKNELNTWQKLIGTQTIPHYSISPTAWYPLFRDTRNLKPSGKVRLRNIKIEEGPTATPYQPNLLDAPYYLSKVSLGENIANPTINFPINSSGAELYQGNMTEPFVVGQTYTITLKGTKPATQLFRVFNPGIAGYGNLSPVEGLTNVWALTFTPKAVSTDPKILQITQTPNESVGACQIDWLKIEKGNTRTPNIDSYKYLGSYTDFDQTDSLNPTKYSWSLIKGSDGIAGKDGVGVSNTNITYAQSTSGTTAPTSGWTAQVPILVKGQYLWTRTVWTYTDNSNETGYTVSYNAKDGNNGTDGIAGKDGVGITGTLINYASSTSGTAVPSTGWSATIPTVTPGNYLWTRTVWTYSDDSTETGYSVAGYGSNGTDGTNGQDGVSVIGSEVSYTQSTSGNVAPTTGWTTTMPAPVVGQYLWTRSRNVFSNSTYGAYAYSVALNGRDAVIISETAPSNPSVGTLWQKPSDATKTVLEWNGTAWVNWGISVDNIVAENITANDGRFEKITGLEVEGGVIRNPYQRTYDDGSTATGEIVLADNQYTNSGYTFNPSDQTYRIYSQELGPQFISMNMYSASDPNTQTGLLYSAAMTYDLINLTDVANGFTGTLEAKQLTKTPWINLTYVSGFSTAEGNPCQYRIIYDLQGNKVVQLRGQVTRAVGMQGTTYPFTAMPTGMRVTRNKFAPGTGDAEALQTVRVGIINQSHASVPNMIQVKCVGASSYVDISGLEYIVE